MCVASFPRRGFETDAIKGLQIDRADSCVFPAFASSCFGASFTRKKLSMQRRAWPGNSAIRDRSPPDRQLRRFRIEPCGNVAIQQAIGKGFASSATLMVPPVGTRGGRACAWTRRRRAPHPDAEYRAIAGARSPTQIASRSGQLLPRIRRGSSWAKRTRVSIGMCAQIDRILRW